jgi:hypothetical protein
LDALIILAMFGAVQFGIALLLVRGDTAVVLEQWWTLLRHSSVLATAAQVAILGAAYGQISCIWYEKRYRRNSSDYQRRAPEPNRLKMEADHSIAAASRSADDNSSGESNVPSIRPERVARG